MSFLTPITRSSLRFPLTPGPGYLAAFHTSSSTRSPPEMAKEPAGEQSQQKLRQKMNQHHQWSEDVASSSESIVKADRGEIEGSEEVEMEEKRYKQKREQQKTEKKQ